MILNDNPRDPDIWYLYTFEMRTKSWKLIAGTGLENVAHWLFTNRVATSHHGIVRLMHGDEIVAQVGEAAHPG